MIKIGDRVKFVSDVGVGKVVKIAGSTIDVDVEGGFIIPCNIAELVVVQEEDEIAAIKSIGVGDERPGVKKVKKGSKDEKKDKVKKEPAYAKYGKISLINDYRDEDEESDAEEDDFDDSYLDLNRINDIYIRNKAAAERREHEFEEARKRQETAKLNVVESSVISVEHTTPSSSVEIEIPKDSMKKITLEELAAKVEQDKPKPIIASKKEDKKSDIEVIDLHAGELLDTTSGLSSGEILTSQLARFTIAMDLALGSGKHGKIVFIHGVGSGKLKFELQKLLRSKYPKISSQDASFREYGYGAIMIFY